MKGKIALILTAAMCAGGMAWARVPVDDIALGGLTPNVTEEDVISIYGEPDEKTDVMYDRYAWNAYVQKFTYGSTVNLNFISNSEDGPFYATLVNTTANNGFNTPRGIHVGSTRRDVINAYGYPDIGNPYGKQIWYKGRERAYDLVFHMEGDIVKSISIGYNA